jgi:threonine synthase
MFCLAESLQLQPFSVAQEKQTQIEVERFLKQKGYRFEREIRLSEKDIPDFLVHTERGGIIIEVKTRFARRAIYRQLERYAEHEKVHGLILLTGTSMKLPQEIKGKPSLVASLGAGWL